MLRSSKLTPSWRNIADTLSHSELQLPIHAFNKSGRHLEFSINDVSNLDTLFDAEAPPLRWTVVCPATTLSFKGIGFQMPVNAILTPHCSIKWWLSTDEQVHCSLTFHSNSSGVSWGVSRLVSGNKDPKVGWGPVNPNRVSVYLVSDRLVYHN